VALRPDLASMRLNLGTTLLTIGRVEAGVEQLAKARELDPSLQDAAFSHLLGGLYIVRDPAEDLAAARAWAEGLGAARLAVPSPHANPRDPGRRLRVGYVSPDFCRHVVSCFIEPVLAAHDRGAVEVWCYASVKKPDEVTARLKSLADQWRDVAAEDDEALAVRVRADGIDILVDLAGHTIGSRLAMFARRPAPIQLGWLGYPATTGLQQIDARIVDALTDPPGLTESQNSEKLLRLPGGFNCYRPPEDAPSVGGLPAAANGYVTFGSFNHAAKITPEALRLWAALLRVVPKSRLLIKHRGFDVASVRAAYVAELARHGATAERVELVAHVREVNGHFGTYNRVDVSLDSFPYNGTTTTCESLWMGVPVVTLAGASHRARVGASLLTRAGYPGLVAATPREYVDIAAGLAGNLTSLAALRAGLRATFAASPVCDGVALTRHLESAFRDLWREWCAAPARP
jgi:predicted O-linked N-acetylglucosamine transferase (SPINDLY family)